MAHNIDMDIDMGDEGSSDEDDPPVVKSEMFQLKEYSAKILETYKELYSKQLAAAPVVKKVRKKRSTLTSQARKNCTENIYKREFGGRPWLPKKEVEKAKASKTPVKKETPLRPPVSKTDDLIWNDDIMTKLQDKQLINNLRAKLCGKVHVTFDNLTEIVEKEDESRQTLSEEWDKQGVCVHRRHYGQSDADASSIIQTHSILEIYNKNINKCASCVIGQEIEELKISRTETPPPTDQTHQPVFSPPPQFKGPHTGTTTKVPRVIIKPNTPPADPSPTVITEPEPELEEEGEDPVAPNEDGEINETIKEVDLCRGDKKARIEEDEDEEEETDGGEDEDEESIEEVDLCSEDEGDKKARIEEDEDEEEETDGGEDEDEESIEEVDLCSEDEGDEKETIEDEDEEEEMDDGEDEDEETIEEIDLCSDEDDKEEESMEAEKDGDEGEEVEKDGDEGEEVEKGEDEREEAESDYDGEEAEKNEDEGEEAEKDEDAEDDDEDEEAEKDDEDEAMEEEEEEEDEEPIEGDINGAKVSDGSEIIETAARNSTEVPTIESNLNEGSQMSGSGYLPVVFGFDALLTSEDDEFNYMAQLVEPQSSTSSLIGSEATSANVASVDQLPGVLDQQPAQDGVQHLNSLTNVGTPENAPTESNSNVHLMDEEVDDHFSDSETRTTSIAEDLELSDSDSEDELGSEEELTDDSTSSSSSHEKEGDETEQVTDKTEKQLAISKSRTETSAKEVPNCPSDTTLASTISAISTEFKQRLNVCDPLSGLADYEMDSLRSASGSRRTSVAEDLELSDSESDDEYGYDSEIELTNASALSVRSPSPTRTDIGFELVTPEPEENLAIRAPRMAETDIEIEQGVNEVVQSLLDSIKSIEHDKPIHMNSNHIPPSSTSTEIGMETDQIIQEATDDSEAPTGEAQDIEIIEVIEEPEPEPEEPAEVDGFDSALTQEEIALKHLKPFLYAMPFEPYNKEKEDEIKRLKLECLRKTNPDIPPTIKDHAGIKRLSKYYTDESKEQFLKTYDMTEAEYQECVRDTNPTLCKSDIDLKWDVRAGRKVYFPKFLPNNTGNELVNDYLNYIKITTHARSSTTEVPEGLIWNPGPEYEEGLASSESDPVDKAENGGAAEMMFSVSLFEAQQPRKPGAEQMFDLNYFKHMFGLDDDDAEGTINLNDMIPKLGTKIVGRSTKHTLKSLCHAYSKEVSLKLHQESESQSGTRIGDMLLSLSDDDIRSMPNVKDVFKTDGDMDYFLEQVRTMRHKIIRVRSGTARDKVREEDLKVSDPDVDSEPTTTINLLATSSLETLCNAFICYEQFRGEEVQTCQDLFKTDFEEPEKEPQYFITGLTVYCDTDNVTTVRFVEKLIENHNFGKMVMESWKIPLDNLHLSLGSHYTFVHHGTCEHQVVFKEARVTRPSELKILKESPHVIYFNDDSEEVCDMNYDGCQEVARFVAEQTPQEGEPNIKLACLQCAKKIHHPSERNYVNFIKEKEKYIPTPVMSDPKYKLYRLSLQMRASDYKSIKSDLSEASKEVTPIPLGRPPLKRNVRKSPNKVTSVDKGFQQGETNNSGQEPSLMIESDTEGDTESEIGSDIICLSPEPDLVKPKPNPRKRPHGGAVYGRRGLKKSALVKEAERIKNFYSKIKPKASTSAIGFSSGFVPVESQNQEDVMRNNNDGTDAAAAATVVMEASHTQEPIPTESPSDEVPGEETENFPDTPPDSVEEQESKCRD